MTDLTLQPPPERNLAPDRHTALRTDVLAEIRTGIRPKRGIEGLRRPWLVPLTAAAAVVLLAVGLTAAVTGGGRDEQRPAVGVIDEPVTRPQLTQTCRAEAERAIRDNNSPDPKVRATADPAGTRLGLAVIPRIRAVQVTNFAASGPGAYAALRGTDIFMLCMAAPVRSKPGSYSAHVYAIVLAPRLHWLKKKYTIEGDGSIQGVGDVGPMMMGRSTADIVRLSISTPGHVDNVRPVGGVWIARSRNAKASFRGYDAGGNLVLEDSGEGEPSTTTCVRTPTGALIPDITGEIARPENCAPGIAWP